jgi:hypothetical protein
MSAALVEQLITIDDRFAQRKQVRRHSIQGGCRLPRW